MSKIRPSVALVLLGLFVFIGIYFWSASGKNELGYIGQKTKDPSANQRVEVVAGSPSQDGLIADRARDPLLQPSKDLGSFHARILTPEGQALVQTEVFFCPVGAAVPLGIRDYPGVDGSVLSAITRQATSDSNGEFSFEGLEPGPYAFLAWTPDYLPIEKIYSVKPGLNRAEFQAAGIGFSITGKVIDANRSPLEKVQLVAIRSTPDQTRFKALSDEELLQLQMFSEVESSNAAGQFMLRGLSDGFFDVLAIDGKSPVQVRNRIAAGTTDLTFVISGAAGLLGSVLDEQGSPIPNPQIAAQTYFGGADFSGSGRGMTDESGKYEIRELKAGGISVDVFAEAKGFARVQISLPPFTPGEQRQLDITLPRALATSGLVKSRKGEALSGVQISFGGAGKSSYGGLDPIVTNSRGEFVIESTQEGHDYFIYLTKEGYESKLFQPVRGGQKDIILFLDPYATVRARLVPEDRATSFGPFTVEIFSEDEHEAKSLVTNRSFPGGNGEFVLSAVSPTSNALQAYVPGYAPALLFDFQGRLESLGEEGVLEIPLKRGRTIKGRLIDKESRAAIQGASIFSTSHSRQGLPRNVGFFSTQSQEDGSFSLQGVETAISIHAPGYAQRILSVSKSDGTFQSEGSKPIDFGEIVLARGGRAIVRAFDEREAPIAGMEISYRRHGFSSVDAGYTDDRGSLIVEDLEAGEYEISAWDWRSTFQLNRPYAHSSTVVIKEGQDSAVTFQMKAGGTVMGHVHWGTMPDPYSSPSAAVYLIPMNVENDPQAQYASYWARVNGSGDFWIPHVPGGRYLATLKSFFLPQRYDLSREVIVVDHEEVRLDLTALPSGLAGEIQDAQTGKPVGVARIRVESLSPKSDQPLLYSQFDGRFGVIGIHEGSYRLRVSKEGFAEEDFGPFDVHANRVTEGILVQLLPQGLLHVAVANKSGVPISGASVRLLATARELLVDAGGAVVFDQLKPSSYHIEIQAPGYAKKLAGPAMVESGKQTTLSVTLRRLCTLKIQVQGANGAAAPAGATLTLLDQETGDSWPVSPTILEGAATVNDLPEGMWKIELASPAGNAQKSVEVLPGQANLVTLSL